ncbi:hypothetical protein MVEN_00066700 [Mycena venus]|uniref:Uncharacterized protein n=1 Tax=Mycena venus TaxID=2733690 RepID=A0A8H7DE31_9AGAR|nr:hypothetical protein MVEN_00066700 [Mycena venus]
MLTNCTQPPRGPHAQVPVLPWTTLTSSPTRLPPRVTQDLSWFKMRHNWLHVILNEGHCIKNTDTKVAVITLMDVFDLGAAAYTLKVLNAVCTLLGAIQLGAQDHVQSGATASGAAEGSVYISFTETALKTLQAA